MPLCPLQSGPQETSGHHRGFPHPCHGPEWRQAVASPGRHSSLSVPLCSHRYAEGQGTRVIYRQGQPLLPRRLWPGHEGGHAPALRLAAEQERWVPPALLSSTSPVSYLCAREMVGDPEQHSEVFFFLFIFSGVFW